MTGHERNVGLIGENLREYGLWTGDHESQGCSRQGISIPFRTINLFEFSWMVCRKSTWWLLHL